jgi:hypothetical protein
MKFYRIVHDNISENNMKVGPKFKDSGRRSPTLVGIPSPFKPGKLSRDPKDTRGQVRPPVILDQMKKGGTRQENYYFNDNYGQRLLSVKFDISCDIPKRVYHFDIRANFVVGPPPPASIKFIANHRLLTRAPLAAGGKLFSPSVSMEFDPSIETVFVEIEIEGSPVLPRYLTATITNRLARRT